VAADRNEKAVRPTKLTHACPETIRAPAAFGLQQYRQDLPLTTSAG
jgi:hypothetical protein